MIIIRKAEELELNQSYIYIINLILGEEKYLIYFKHFSGAKTGYGTICRKTFC